MRDDIIWCATPEGCRIAIRRTDHPNPKATASLCGLAAPCLIYHWGPKQTLSTSKLTSQRSEMSIFNFRRFKCTNRDRVIETKRTRVASAFQLETAE